MTENSFNFRNLKGNNRKEKEREVLESREISYKKKKELEKTAMEVLGDLIETVEIVEDHPDEIKRKYVADEANKIINSHLFESNRSMSPWDKEKVIDYVLDEVFGYGPITQLIDDSTVTEIMVNGPEDVFVERMGKIYKVDNSFRDDNHILHTIDKIITPLGRRVDESSPMVDARLPDGSRVNVILPPLAVKGPTLTIRKFATDPYTLEDLISFGTINQDVAKFLRSCVRGRINIVVAGGTGSGKTTLLNVISSFIPEEERIVTIEDAAELQLQQEHVVSLESRPANIEGKGLISIRDLVINSLRMRPDRIIVGEVRGGETLDMLQAMNTGHDGSITTVHANSPRDTLGRMETMVMMAGMELPSKAIREQISSAINLIVFCARLNDGSRKITRVSEIVGMEGDTISLQDIYTFDRQGFAEDGTILGKHEPTGIIPNFLEELKYRGENVASSIFEK